MASSINNATITSKAGSPTVQYDVTYTATRISNAEVTYKFTIKTSLLYSDSYIYNGYKLTAYFSVNGEQESVVLKDNDAYWSGKGVKSTKTVSVTAPSTTANAKQTVTFKVVNKGTLDGTSGEITTTDYYVTSPALLYTDCTAPTTFTTSSSPFESNVTLSWSGAKGGTNNSIEQYRIRYATSKDNENWSAYSDLTTDTSSPCTIDMSDKVSRGYYVKFAIRTEGSAGSSYYSTWKYSSSIRRNPYTKCTAPTSFSVSPNNFDTSVTLSWSGASGGTNNAISSYLIQYSVSDTTTFKTWTTLKTISTTKTSYSLDDYNVSSIVKRKQYIKFRIRTQGAAGSSYYSDYKESSYVRRNPYTACGAPTKITLTSDKDLNGATHNDVFESSITMSWSGAKSGENNNIVGYRVEYRISNDQTTWGSWITYSEIDSEETSYTYEMSKIATTNTTRGQYVQFRLKTIGSISGYDSDYVTTSTMRKNSQPPNIQTINVTPATLEYSYGDNITIAWTQYDACKYAVRLYPNITDKSKYVDYETTSPTFTLNANDTNYQTIANNQQLAFAVQPIDIFGVRSSSYKQSATITRYDITGVAIGINNKWVNCQLYVGVNGQWIEQEALAGVNGSWLECGV